MRLSGSSIVIATGATVLLAAVAHHLQELSAIGQTVGPTAALALDGGLAAALVYAGWRLRYAEFTTAAKRSIGAWTVAGALAGTGIEGLTLGIQVLEGRPIAEPTFHVLTTVGVSALVLFVAGYYSNRTRTAARRYDSIFNNTFQFTGLLRPDGTVVEANDTALEFGGIESEEVIGEHLADTPWFDHSDAASKRVRESVDRAASGEFVRYETDAQGDDGLRTIDFSLKPVRDSRGNVSRVIVEGRDVTDLQQQRQHLQVLHRVLRHNIRNDLTKIRGWTRQTAEASDPDERAASTDRVTRVTDSWEKLITDVKTIQSAIGSTRPASTPAESLVAGVVESKRNEHPMAAIGLTLAEATGGEVSATIREAVAEAIDNAVAASNGPPTVEVAIADRDTDWIRIAVSDDGPGMPDGETTILETGEETTMTHGDGLGVWKIRMLVKESGGRVSVDASDDGTRLSFLLPTC